MVFNWLYNWKYSKQHVSSAIVLQKYVRGFLTRQGLKKKLVLLEKQHRVFMKWHSIAQQSKKIEAECENTMMDLDKTFEHVTEDYYVRRIYQKKRSLMVQQIADLDRIMRQITNDGDILPRKMFSHSGLFVHGHKIIPAY